MVAYDSYYLHHRQGRHVKGLLKPLVAKKEDGELYVIHVTKENWNFI